LYKLAKTLEVAPEKLFRVWTNNCKASDSR
jgi:hypothetical protein